MLHRILLAIFLIIFIFIMADRYKKIEFKNFEIGESGKNFSDTPKIQYSNKIQLNENDTIEIGKKLNSITIANAGVASQIQMGLEYNNSGVHYIFVTEQIAGNDHACLYKTTAGGAPTLVKDFGIGIAGSVWEHKGEMWVNYYDDDALGTDVTKKSTTPTVSASWSEQTDLRDYPIVDYTALGEDLYFLTNWGLSTKGLYVLMKSNDLGSSFSEVGQVFTGSGTYVQGTEIETYQNFVYIAGKTLSRLENDVPVEIQKIHLRNLFKIGEEFYGQEYVSNYIYKFNGDKFELLHKISGNPTFVGIGENKAYFEDEEFVSGTTYNYTYYAMNEKEAIIKEFIYENKAEDDWKPKMIWGNKEDLYFLIEDLNTPRIIIDNSYVKKYESAGDITSTIIDVGEIVPKQIIVKHDPLPAKATDSTTNTNEALDATETEITVLDSTKVTNGTYISIEDEYMLITAINSAVSIEVERGVLGTLATTHDTNKDIYNLTSPTNVKVYIKKDRASDWKSAILTSSDLGAVKKKYTFPAGETIDFAEFKIELTTSDDTKTPENVKLEFLYLPVGLENAK